jgi:hypothetical protein
VNDAVGHSGVASRSRSCMTRFIALNVSGNGSTSTTNTVTWNPSGNGKCEGSGHHIIWCGILVGPRNCVAGPWEKELLMLAVRKTPAGVGSFDILSPGMARIV